jgi:hypothetical protein
VEEEGKALWAKKTAGAQVSMMDLERPSIMKSKLSILQCRAR